MGKFIDLTGNKYGKLTVLKRVNSRNKCTLWLCKCDCGNQKEIGGNHLKSGGIKSCRKCSINRWVVEENYVVGSASNEEFLIDYEDFESVKKHNWTLDKYGYVVTRIDGKGVKLHRFIMNPNRDKVIDHINQNLSDNRKTNLRICKHEENVRNRQNVKGYHWLGRIEKYQASIGFNKKSIYLGVYPTEDEARLAYCTKAIELFGEFVHEDVVKDHERLSKKLNKSQDNT